MTRRPPIEPYYVQKNDNLDEIAKTLRPAIEFTDEDLRRLSPVSAQDDVLKCRNSGVAHETTLGLFDSIVHSTIGVPATALEDGLERRGSPAWTIGGAVVRRTLFDAMHDAQGAACAIGRSA